MISKTFISIPCELDGGASATGEEALLGAKDDGSTLPPPLRSQEATAAAKRLTTRCPAAEEWMTCREDVAFCSEGCRSSVRG